MTLTKRKGLPYKERFILYLFLYSHQDYEVSAPEELTAKGISKAIGCAETHINRISKPLMEEGCVVRDKKHIVSDYKRRKRRYVYSLTSKGIRYAKSILKRLNLDKDKIHDLLEIDREEIDEGRVLEELFGRKEEQRALRDFLYSKGKRLAVVTGTKGIGKTALVNKVLDDLGKMVHRLKRPEDISTLAPPLRGVVLIELSDWTGDLFLLSGDLVKKADKMGCKVILALRMDVKENPMPKGAIHIKLGGLDPEHIASILGCGDGETVDMITSVSGGNPFVAKMLYLPDMFLPEDMTIEEYLLMRYMKLKSEGVI